MTILELLTRAAGIPAAKLRELILAGASASPDLAEEAALLIAKLDSALSTENLGVIAASIASELAAIGRGEIKPHDHPSDAA